MNVNIPSAENANCASNLVVTTNDWVDLALFRKCSEVHRVLLEGIKTLLGRLGLDSPVTSDLFDGCLQGSLGQANFLEESSNVWILQKRKQDVVLRYIRVMHSLL